MTNTEREVQKQAVDDLRGRFLALRRSPFSSNDWRLFNKDLLQNPAYKFWVANQASITGYHEDDRNADGVDANLFAAKQLFNRGETSEAARFMRSNVPHALTGAHDAARDPAFELTTAEEGITLNKEGFHATPYSESLESVLRDLDARVRRLEGEV